MIGKIISHYKILEKPRQKDGGQVLQKDGGQVGKGGMGVFYKAEDTKLKRIVGLKFLKPQALGSEEQQIRFVHEARGCFASPKR